VTCSRADATWPPANGGCCDECSPVAWISHHPDGVIFRERGALLRNFHPNRVRRGRFRPRYLGRGHRGRLL